MKKTEEEGLTSAMVDGGCRSCNYVGQIWLVASGGEATRMKKEKLAVLFGLDPKTEISKERRWPFVAGGFTGGDAGRRRIGG